MEVNPNKLQLGAVKIHKDVIASIASIAALEIEGVRQIGKGASLVNIFELLGLAKAKPIQVEFGKNDDIKLEIPLIVKYGANISEIAEKVQENVRLNLEKMLDRSPRDISINIQGIEK